MEDFKEKKFKFFINLFSLNFHQFLLGKWEKKYFNIFSFSFFMLYMFGFQFFFEENMRKNREKKKKDNEK